MTSPGPIFLGGCPRSGLTLLGAMLDAHPAVSCGPEAGLIGLALASRDFTANLRSQHEQHFQLPPGRVRANFAEAMGRILDARRLRLNKARAAERSAMNVLVFTELAAMFPNAQFIHCVRDGRDVAASLLELQWRHPTTGDILPHCAEAGAAARYWAELVSIGLKAEEQLHGRILRVSYDRLVSEPASEATRIADFLGLSQSATLLDFHKRNDWRDYEDHAIARLQQPLHSAQKGRWKRELTDPQHRRVKEQGAGALAALGYL